MAASKVFLVNAHRMVTARTIFGVYGKALRRYRWSVLFLFIILSVVVTIEVITPLYYKKFFDGLASGGDPRLLWHWLWVIFGLNALVWAIYRVCTYWGVNVTARVMTDLTEQAFEYLQHHSIKFFSNSFVGSLVKKITRLSRSFEVIVDKVYWNLYPLALRIVIVEAIVWKINPVIAMLLIVWTVIFLVSNYAFATWKLPYDTKRAAKDTETTGVIADAITNHANIHLFHGFRFEFARVKKVVTELTTLRIFTWNLDNLIESMQHGLMVVVEFGLIAALLWYWQKGQVTIGTFVLLQTYLIQLFIRIWDFGRNIRNIYEALADAKEMVEILHQPHEIVDSPTAKPLVIAASAPIEFKDVQFSYHQTRVILKKMHLTIKGGEKIALIGPSGSGKSTIIKLLFRLYEIDSGKILIDGANIQKVTQETLHNAMSLVPQDPILFHRTLMENIRYGRWEASDDEVIEAAKLAHCHEFIMEFPNAYETFVGERGVKLSGGERQRVAIARAILRDAPILVLDEATSSLDSHSEALIQDALKSLMVGKTTIVIAHRLSTIQQMDRIIVLDHGIIIEEGTHATLLKKKGSMYQRLWKIQAGGFLVDEGEEKE